MLLIEHDAHLFAVLIEQEAGGDAQYQQYDELAQRNAAAGDQEADKAEAGIAEEDRDLQSYDDAVEERGHQQREEGDILDADIAQSVHGKCRQQACKRAEDHVIEAQTRGNGADVGDDTADRQTGDRRRGVDREDAQYLCDAELYRCRCRTGQKRVLSDREHGVERGDDRRLCDVQHTFVFHILFSP